MFMNKPKRPVTTVMISLLMAMAAGAVCAAGGKGPGSRPNNRMHYDQSIPQWVKGKAPAQDTGLGQTQTQTQRIESPRDVASGQATGIMVCNGGPCFNPVDAERKAPQAAGAQLPKPGTPQVREENGDPTTNSRSLANNENVSEWELQAHGGKLPPKPFIGETVEGTNIRSRQEAGGMVDSHAGSLPTTSKPFIGTTVEGTNIRSTQETSGKVDSSQQPRNFAPLRPAEY